MVSKYSCCQERSGSPGCQLAKVRGQAAIKNNSTSDFVFVSTRIPWLNGSIVYNYIMSHPYKLDGVMSLYSGTSE